LGGINVWGFLLGEIIFGGEEETSILSIFKIKILFKKMFSNLFTCVAEQNFFQEYPKLIGR
jgi:hypothetical protein